jgi:anthranilate/para-aminobenzoate synthase component II
MTDPKVRALHERIAELEAEVAALRPARAQEAAMRAAEAPHVVVVPTPKRAHHAAPKAKR